MVNKKSGALLPLLFSLVLVTGIGIGYELRDQSTGLGFFGSSTKTPLEDVLNLVKKRYVDPVSIDSINNALVEDVLSHLDPHSAYIPSADRNEANEELMGNFQGIGIEYEILNDTVNVMHVIKDGPSEKAGIEVGDELIKADDSIHLSGNKISSEDIRKRLRGPQGSSVKITVLRNGKPKNIIIERGNIPLPSVDVAYVIAPQTGYIHLNKFSQRTYEEFMQALEKLQKQGIKKLILDLRGNGGGLMSEAVSIADEFLDNDKLIVYTQGYHSPREEYHCQKEGLFETGQLVVLVDETSASASEILAGALQDWDRATIIGRRSFGKGLVQQPFTLSNGGELRLTVARYYTPVGRNIQKPYNKGKDEYMEELYNRFHDGEVTVGDTSSKPKGHAFKTKGGHIVYGGGGITPDIFVAYDTSSTKSTTGKLQYKGTLSTFVYKWFVSNKQRFMAVQNLQQLQQASIMGNSEWQLLNRMAAKDSIALNNLSAKDKVLIQQKVEALMARQVWDTDKYFEVANKTDEIVQKALSVLK